MEGAGGDVLMEAPAVPGAPCSHAFLMGAATELLLDTFSPPPEALPSLEDDMSW
jgi:hypothetical protein